MSAFNRCGLFFFALLRALMRILPTGVSIPFGRGVGVCVGQFVSRERAVAKAQIRHAARHASESIHNEYAVAAPPATSEFAAPANLLDKTFAHCGESVIELFILDKLLQRDDSRASGFRYIESTGQEIVRGLKDAGIGAVTLSGHIGCFELLAAFHVAWGVQLTVSGRDANYPLLSSILRDLRKSYGVDSVFRDEVAGPRKIIKAVRSGEVFAALIDQDTGLENGFAPFFGLDAASPIGPIRLAVKMRAPVLTSFIVRTSRLHHHVITRRIDYNPDDEAAPQKILAEFNRQLEDLIVRYPDQWLWWHRRWRRRPEVNYLESPDDLRKTPEYIRWLDLQGAGGAAR